MTQSRLRTRSLRSPGLWLSRRYDRSPELRQEEHDELARLFEQSQEPIRSSTKHRLKRLVDPLEDAFALDMRSQKRFLCDHTHRVHRDAPTSNDVLGLVH